MTQSSKLLDTSSDLLVQRFHTGIKLVRPDKNQSLQKNWRSVSQMLNMPFAVYFMNTDSVIRRINDITAINCGFNSIKDSLGKTVHVVAKKECAELSVQHDRAVITSNEMKIKDESFQRLKDDAELPAISIKFPWYGANNKVIGIIGCSLLIQNGCLFSNALSLMVDAGLLSHFPAPQYKMEDTILTPREKGILHYIVRGKSAKDTAAILSLSCRTVENYLANIKVKLGVSSKSELIEKMINYIM